MIKTNIKEEVVQGHRFGKKLTNSDYGTVAFLLSRNDILRDKKAISMIPYVAHCADRRRRSGAQTSATEVERSRTGRRSVRAQWRTPPEGEVWV